MLFSGAAVLLSGAPTDVPDDLPSYVLGVDTVSYVDPTPGPEALNLAIFSTSSTNQVIAETSGPVSAGLTSAAAVRRWRTLPFSATNMGAKQYSMSATPIDMITEYKYLFPSPVAGQVIWFRFREVAYPGLAAIPIVNMNWQTYRLVVT